jgi:vacuolar-type H+-ATPase subunit H
MSKLDTRVNSALRVGRGTVRDMSEQNDLLPLRSPEEGGPAFELVRRGYDRDQVENHLAWLEDQLRNAEIARDAAEHAAATASTEAEAAREELERGRPQWHELGDRVTQILTLAEEQGADIRAQRTREADELLNQARQTNADTERSCAALARQAEQQADDLVAKAQTEATQIVTKAQGDADRLLARTQQQATEQERLSNRRLTDLEQQRDAVNAQLTRLHEALASALAPAISIEEPSKSAKQASVDVTDSEYEADYDEYDDMAGSASAPTNPGARPTGDSRRTA